MTTFRLKARRSLPTIPLVTALMAICLVLTAPAIAQVGFDLSGNWTLTATGLLPDENVPCVFEGGGSMIQNGNQLTGNATLMLVSGPDACPAEMMATLDGSLDGNLFGGTLDGGQMFGILDFVGTVGKDGQSIDGTYTVRDGGPFQSVQGDWSSSILRTILQIPTLGGIALGLLVLLLASASIFLLRRAA